MATNYARQVRLSADELTAFLKEAFPVEAQSYGTVLHVGQDHAQMRLDPQVSMLRPGGIVSGPVQMGLIDVAAYVVVLAHIGPVAMAVTNSLSVTFLRPCRCEALFADARLLKLGRRLATIDVRLWQSSEGRLVAQATVGYALP